MTKWTEKAIQAIAKGKGEGEERERETKKKKKHFLRENFYWQVFPRFQQKYKKIEISNQNVTPA